MPAAVNLFDLAALDTDARAALMRRTEADLGPYREPVARIVEAVRTEGDAAVARFGREFDRAELTPDRLKASAEEFEEAERLVEPEVKAAIAFAVENIKRVHDRQKPERMWLETIRPGVLAGDRYTPIPSVACYVPRGKGAFPSVMMMTTVPAVIAGVPEIAVLTPPTPEGGVDAASLVAARRAGVETVYKCGGAVAVAAAAFGTETIPRCMKIVGPGSPWLVAAKQQLAGLIDTGLPAGPSESIVLADGTADPALAAMDLLVESEHGADSSAYLVTDSRAVAEAARALIPELWKEMRAPLAGFSEAVLTGPRGGIVLAPSMAEAIAFVNDYAPEHLQITGDDPHQYLDAITNAAEILLGDRTPFTLGNFVIGVNCVLPTGGHAKTWSPLSVFDFLKRSSITQVTAKGYATLAPHARVLATYEGFDAHANAVSERREALRRR
ncbi:MAG: histidinol dehydrogenase [Alphaproteobacteria bacterium]